MSFIISTDSCCDIPSKKLKELNVNYIFLSTVIDGKSSILDYNSDEDYQRFYKELLEGKLPTTSQINIFDFEKYFSDLLDNNQGDLVHISISSGLSGSYGCAMTASNNLKSKYPNRKIIIIDSLSACFGQATLVDVAVELRAKGKSFQLTTDILNDLVPNIQHWIFINDLKHLKRGGRIGTASALIGTILKLKPVLTLNDKGQVKLVHKTFGVQRALKFFIESIEKYGEQEIISHGEKIPLKIYIGHTEDKQHVNTLMDLIKQKIKCSFHIGYAGTVIGTHVGPGALGIFFLGKKRIKA